MKQKELKDLIKSIQKNASDYFALTCKPLGVSGELGELLVCEHLDLTLMKNARNTGFDAYKDDDKYEIKTRVYSGKNFWSQRTSKINISEEWDFLILSILDPNYELSELYKINRKKVLKRLNEPGSKARNKKRTLSLRFLKKESSKISI